MAMAEVTPPNERERAIETAKLNAAFCKKYHAHVIYEDDRTHVSICLPSNALIEELAAREAAEKELERQKNNRCNACQGRGL